MLQIIVPICPEGWDAKNEVFVKEKTLTLQLEHSLVSLSRWESKWCKAFYSMKEKTYEETIDYIRCMTVNSNVSEEVYDHLTNENIRDIEKYIDAPMTALTFYNHEKEGSARENITSEFIYYWMISLNIPFECQKWHLNRLIALIRFISVKSSPPKKMTARERSMLNASRRAKLNSTG